MWGRGGGGGSTTQNMAVVSVNQTTTTPVCCFYVCLRGIPGVSVSLMYKLQSASTKCGCGLYSKGLPLKTYLFYVERTGGGGGEVTFEIFSWEYLFVRTTKAESTHSPRRPRCCPSAAALPPHRARAGRSGPSVCATYTHAHTSRLIRAFCNKYRYNRSRPMRIAQNDY